MVIMQLYASMLVYEISFEYICKLKHSKRNYRSSIFVHVDTINISWNLEMLNKNLYKLPPHVI